MTGTSVFSLLGKIAIDGVDESKKALNDVSKTGEDTKKKLDVSFKDIANKAGDMGKKMALGLAGVVTAAVAGVEATREFRQDYGKLETTFETTNQKAGTAKETFKTLFGILGEDDTAIETANHLAMMTNNEKDLAQWTDVLTGVYATFGDSLPLEGLAEAANETARVGQVTGPLADALNWAGVSEEAFNEKLLECTSTQEREKLIRETLNGLYGEASETYKDVNGNVIANNEAQAELNMKLADATAKIEPLITKGKIFLAEVLEKLEPVITWVIDNMDILAPIILTVVGAMTLFSVTMGIVNAVMMASPVTWIVLAIVAALAALVAIIVLVVKNWDKIKDTAKNVWNGIKEIWGKVANWFNEKVIQPIVKFFQNLWSKIKDIWNSIKETTSNVFNGIKNTISNIINGIKNTISNVFNGIKNTVTTIWNGVKNAITKPIEKARDLVKGIVDKIKGFFKFNISFPKIKLPHFGIKPKGWQIGDLLKGSIPKLGIDWYAKAVRSPMLLDKPTAFGISPSGNIQVGGEAGSEIVGGTSTIMGMISDAVSSNNGGIENKLDKLIYLFSNLTQVMSNQQVVLSTGELVGAIASPMDRALGQLADDRRRGR